MSAYGVRKEQALDLLMERRGTAHSVAQALGMTPKNAGTLLNRLARKGLLVAVGKSENESGQCARIVYDMARTKKTQEVRT